MRQQWIGMATAALLLGSAGGALAHEGKSHQTSMQGEHRLSGKVAAIKGDTLYLNREEAIIPLKITQSTEVEGKQLMKSESINRQITRDFPVGEEVRASFKVESETDNVAVKLDAAGMRHQGSQQSQQTQPSGSPSQGK